MVISCLELIIMHAIWKHMLTVTSGTFMGVTTVTLHNSDDTTCNKQLQVQLVKKHKHEEVH